MDLFSGLSGRTTEKIAVNFVRQSSRIQEEKHTGSGDMQLAQSAFLESIGWPADRIVTIDARGESGRANAVRPKFEELRRRVRSGEVGLVVVARSDRLGRNDVDSATFLQAAAETHTLIMVGGRIYNPAADADSMMLGVLSKLAEYENRAQIRWMMMARFAKAGKLAFRICLPTGLIWASPDDDVYTSRLEEAGLLHWLDNLDRHRAVSHEDGRSYYILPYPDAKVVHSMELRLRWLLETGDPREVLTRIRESADWVMPGYLPVMERSVRMFDPARKPRWAKGTWGQQWDQLRTWFRSPALYGIYAFNAPHLAKITSGAEEREFTVWFEDAFPSFADADTASLVRSIYARTRRGWKQGCYRGARPHALEQLACTEATEKGTCQARLTAMYQADGSFRYYSQACGKKGHSVPTVGPEVDDVVIGAVVAAFDPREARAAIQALRKDMDSVLRRRRDAGMALQRLEERIETASEARHQARMDKNGRQQRHWDARLDALLEEKECRRAELESIQRDEVTLREMIGVDLDKITNLGSDLQALLRNARESDPAMLRAFMRMLIDRVHFRRVTGYIYEVEIEFPTGERMFRRVFPRRFTAVQAAQVWAHGRLADGADPEIVAEELNCARPTKHRVAWNADRVITASYLHEHGARTEIPAGACKPARALARRWGVPHRDVLTAAFLNRPGPASYREGDLLLCPSLRQVHWALPGAALADGAREQR
jgi:hypothetical protein